MAKYTGRGLARQCGLKIAWILKRLAEMETACEWNANAWNARMEYGNNDRAWPGPNWPNVNYYNGLYLIDY